MPFFIIFVMIPLMEIFVFMQVGQHIGLFYTLSLALLTAVLGGSIVKTQGIATFVQAQHTMRAGQIPAKQLFDGLCLVAAGALLITPGFVTDAIGFALLIPPFRNVLRDTLKTRMNLDVQMGSTQTNFHDGQSTHIHDPSAIDGEYEAVNDDQITNKSKDS